MTTESEERGAGSSPPQGYFQQSRDLLHSFVLVLPLLLVYQAGLFLTEAETLNGADFASILLLQWWGWDALLVFNGALVVVGVGGILVLRSCSRFHPKVLLPMVVESTVYALLLGFAINLVLHNLGVTPDLAVELASGGEQRGVGARICLSLGAGVNEEFVFRLGLFGGLTALLSRFLDKGWAVAAAVVVSSVLFSLAHYVGPEDLELYSFLFRLLAGAFFCGLYWLRGFAVAVYTHAIYDVLVMVVFPLLRE